MNKLCGSRTRALVLAIAFVGIGCGDDDGDSSDFDSTFPTGPGRLYEVKDVSFAAVDGVEVGASFGLPPGTTSPELPVVILIHDIGRNRFDWLLSGIFEAFLERGYLPLAIDLRGHGATLLPDDGRDNPFLSLDDLDDFHFDVRAALTWLRTQQGADISRVAVVGAGVGGNVAYVSIGAFPDDLRAGVAVSPGLWDTLLQPLVTGVGVDPFAPHHMLYMVASNDVLPISQTEALSFAAYATELASSTADPKQVAIFEGQDGHGINLLLGETEVNQEAVDVLLKWLDDHLN